MKDVEVIEQLDEYELEILQAVAGGATNTYEINIATRKSLDNRKINYRIDDKDPNLEQRGLVDVVRKDGRFILEDNGQRREFDTPKQVHLTEYGRTILNKVETVREYRYMNHDELVEKILSIDQRIHKLETQVSVLQKELRGLTD